VFSKRLGKAIAEEIVSKSVYLISIGSNDYGSLLNPDSNPVFPPGNHQGFVDSVIGNLTDAITVRTNFTLTLYFLQFIIRK